MSPPHEIRTQPRGLREAPAAEAPGVVALGEELRVRGFALAAVEIVAAESPEEVVAAWRRLPEDTDVLLLTPMARWALADRLDERPRLLHAVLPS